MKNTAFRKLENDLGVTPKTAVWGDGENRYYIEFDSFEECYENHNYIMKFAKRHNMNCDANFTTWRYILYHKKSRKEIEEARKKEKKRDEIRHIFELVYHSTMNGDMARQEQINFIKSHEDYKEIFCDMYNSSYYENLL